MSRLLHGDCMDILPTLKSNSVDAVICDPPYGTIKCKWDTVINLEFMWDQLHRICKPDGAIILFGQEPFSSTLRLSNTANYRYDLIWDKGIGVDFLNANRKPLKSHENISVFYKKACIYNPQKTHIQPVIRGASRARGGSVLGNCGPVSSKSYSSSYPTTLLSFSSQSAECNNKLREHPTQKPLKLMRYLISTYTNIGDHVLDFTMGVGSTCVAAKQLKRVFTGIEMEDNFFKIAQRRVMSVEL